ncbi:unnamed protein product, partial [Brachionus calyciflorus]
MTTNIIKYQTNTTKSMTNIEHDEEFNERKYKRDYYDFELIGNGISGYSNIYERIDEIKRCTGIDNLEMVRPIVEKNSKNMKLKIKVKEYSDYKTLTKEWPLDSFKTGIKIKKSYPNLKVIVLDVQRNFKANQDNIEIKALQDNYGLYNIRRIHNHKNQPCNKITAKCKKISDFIDVIKDGVFIGSKKYRVIPHTVNYRVCSKCGSLKHQQKDCFKAQYCLKCSGTGHHIDNCNSFFDKCINCLGPHKCFSDKCKEFAQKKIFINRFVLKILIGEKFISSASDILQVGNDSKEDQTSESSDTSKLNDLIESIFSDKINNL